MAAIKDRTFFYENLVTIIENYESLLCSAMINSDIALLDKLLASDLVFTNHVGQVISKDDDIDAHRTGLYKIDTLDLSEQRIIPLDEAVVVSVRASINGSFNNQHFVLTLRFTRVWQETAVGWQVVVGHSSIIAEQ